MRLSGRLCRNSIATDALARRDRVYLAWLLARRLAWNGQWDDVIELGRQFGADFGLARQRRKSGFGHMPAVLFVDALQKSGAEREARRTLDWLKDECGEMTEIALLEANHVHAFGDASARPEDWLRVVNRIYEAGGLQPIGLRSGSAVWPRCADESACRFAGHKSGIRARWSAC